jgi:hypothetical protein
MNPHAKIIHLPNGTITQPALLAAPRKGDTYLMIRSFRSCLLHCMGPLCVFSHSANFTQHGARDNTAVPSYVCLCSSLHPHFCVFQIQSPNDVDSCNRIPPQLQGTPFSCLINCTDNESKLSPMCSSRYVGASMTQRSPMLDPDRWCTESKCQKTASHVWHWVIPPI